VTAGAEGEPRIERDDNRIRSVRGLPPGTDPQPPAKARGFKFVPPSPFPDPILDPLEPRLYAEMIGEGSGERQRGRQGLRLVGIQGGESHPTP